MTVSRRDFLKSSTAVTVSLALPAGRAYAAVETGDVRMAVIGVKGRGGEHISSLAKHIVALCDVDRRILADRADALEKRTNRKIDRVVDFREILDRKDVDAVSIATPNHTHALIGVLAAQAGKDVYVEKPVSHNVWEGRQLVHAARTYGRIIQCGTQSRSSRTGIADAVEWVQAGNLGPIQYIVGTCYKPRKPIGKLNEPLRIPDWIDYDLWCGPAEKVDLYRPNLHYDWHWDFNTGNGDMGNQGIHQMDIARWFAGEAALSPRVLSVGGRLGYEDAGDTPNTQVVFHDYPKAPIVFETRGLPRSKEAQEKDWGGSMDEYRGSRVGVVVQCEGGRVVVPNYHSCTAYDNEGKKVKAFAGGGNHFANFLEAVRSRDASKLHAEILDGHLSSALCHTGNISHLLGKRMPAGEIRDQIKSNDLALDSFNRMAEHLRANEVDVDSTTITIGPWLEMDPATERFTNNDEANRLLTREYREPFVVPKLG